MKRSKLGELETIFAEMIWDNEPLRSSELSDMAEERLGWKKTTSYTVLKKLCNKGLFQNKKAVVTSLVSRSEFYTAQSEDFVESTFRGSLPAFLAAFMGDRKLTKEEAEELHRMVDEYREEDD